MKRLNLSDALSIEDSIGQEQVVKVILSKELLECPISAWDNFVKTEVTDRFTSKNIRIEINADDLRRKDAELLFVSFVNKVCQDTALDEQKFEEKRLGCALSDGGVHCTYGNLLKWLNYKNQLDTIQIVMDRKNRRICELVGE